MAHVLACSLALVAAAIRVSRCSSKSMTVVTVSQVS